MACWRIWAMAAALLLVVLTGGRPALADEMADEMAAAVERAVAGMIQPAHQTFAAAAVDLRQAVDGLCAAPSPDRLNAARSAFAAAAAAFGGIEMFRFGPARADNRFERLFYWPDRRSRGFRQITATLREQDPSATDPVALEGKSVALQGLPALDYVLFGKGADGLAAPGADFRCGYARALGVRIAAVATALADEWAGPFARTIVSAGPANPTFRDAGEAVRAILQAAHEQMQITSDYMISRPLGYGSNPPKPMTAPLPQSGLGLLLAEGNIAAVERLMAAMQIRRALEEPEASLQEELAFFLDGARLAVAFARAAGRDWPGVLATPEAKTRIAYAPLALLDATEILGGKLPAALGLIQGFNSLDGD